MSLNSSRTSTRTVTVSITDRSLRCLSWNWNLPISIRSSSLNARDQHCKSLPWRNTVLLLLAIKRKERKSSSEPYLWMVASALLVDCTTRCTTVNGVSGDALRQITAPCPNLELTERDIPVAFSPAILPKHLQLSLSSHHHHHHHPI